jgi:2-methylcitrate dehydratase PrpD
MQQHQLKADDIVKVTAHVHQGAIDVLGPVTDPQTIHQSKFSMGFVLALIATLGRAALADFTEKSLKNKELRNFHDRVTMVLDAEVDGAYPRRWLGRVSVQTRDGRTLECRVDTPKGDPDNTLSRVELEDKAQRLVAYSGAATPAEVQQFIARIWHLRNEAGVRDFMAGR